MTHRKTSTLLRAAFAAPALILLSIALVSGCAPQAAPAPQAPQVSVAEVIERDVTEWDEFTGRLEAVESVEIRPRVTGYIESVAFAEGSIGAQRRPAVRHRPASVSRRARRRPKPSWCVRVARCRAGAQRSGAQREARSSIKAVSREEYDQRVNASREATASVARPERPSIPRRSISNSRASPRRSTVASARPKSRAGNLVTGGSNAATLLTTVVSIDPIYVDLRRRRAGLPQVRGARAPRRARELARRRESRPDGPRERDGLSASTARWCSSTTSSIRAPARSARAPSFDNKDGYLTPGLFARVQAARPQLVPRPCWSTTARSAPTRARSSCTSSTREQGHVPRGEARPR